MLELFKPLQILKDKDNPVLFIDLGYKITNKYGKEKGLRPFIIFYDDKENCYYYIKARDAKYNIEKYLDENGLEVEIKKYKKPFDGEVLIKGNSFKNTLLEKDSYVDCSQIFKIDADLLESLIDVDCKLYKNTNQLKEYEIWNILDKINECCNEIPPNLSIIEVKYNSIEKETYATSLYLSESKIDYYIYEERYGDLDFRNDFEPDFDIKNYFSLPKNTYGKNRYNNAIDFIKMFQEEYFYEEYAKTDYDQKYYEPFKHKELERER